MRESDENSFRPSKLRRCRKYIRCRSFTAFIIMEISGLRLRMKRYWKVGRNSLIPGRTGRISRMWILMRIIRKWRISSIWVRRSGCQSGSWRRQGKDSLWRRKDMRWRWGMRLETLLGIWRLASRWEMCLGIGVWSIIGGGMKEKIYRL